MHNRPGMRKSSARQRQTQAASAKLIQEGLTLHNAGKLPEAEAIYRKILDSDPKNFDAWHLLGVLAQQCGMPVESIALIAQAVKFLPSNPVAHYNLGVAYRETGNREMAANCYLKAVSLKPSYFEAHNNLGTILQEMGKFDEAVKHYRKALSINPGYVQAHHNLGSIYQELGQPEEAMMHYRRAIELDPGFPDPWNNLGNVFTSQGKYQDGINCFRRALQLKPDYAQAHNNLGTAYQDRRMFEEASECLYQAISLSPDYTRAHYNLGVLFQEQGDTAKAIERFRRVLELEPGYHAARAYLVHEMQRICEWKDLEENIEILRRVVREEPAGEKNRISAFAFLAMPGVTPQEEKLCAEKWATNMYGHLNETRTRLSFGFDKHPEIRVGYLSGDFREHPVSQLMTEIFELHDRNHFKIHAYSYGPDDGSAMRQRVEKSFDEFVDIGTMPLEDAARKINADGIDILVDLTGYTTASRSGILALCPAPVQMSYIGYLGTMGADFVDYLIADRFLIPGDQTIHYNEKIAYLPSYQANDRQCRVGSKPSRTTCGLPEDAFVFCCFNQSYKISPEIFGFWMGLLQKKPASVLWLHADAMAASNLRKEAEARGVSGNRLIFAERVPLDAHLGRLQCADLFLDTLPYNAGTTASNALWVGLPVVTCAGETFSSRMAGSLLTALEVPELITKSLEEYSALSLELSLDREKLEALREKIISNRDKTLLFDSIRFTRSLETLFTKALQGIPAHAVRHEA